MALSMFQIPKPETKITVCCKLDAQHLFPVRIKIKNLPPPHVASFLTSFATAGSSTRVEMIARVLRPTTTIIPAKFVKSVMFNLHITQDRQGTYHSATYQRGRYA